MAPVHRDTTSIEAKSPAHTSEVSTSHSPTHNNNNDHHTMTTTTSTPFTEETVTLSRLFGEIERVRISLEIDDYAISQTTLEQVITSFSLSIFFESVDVVVLMLLNRCF
jgi:hypothetical protein